YLARGIFLTLKRPGATLEPDPAAARKSLFSAVAINALNPNPYIFWGTVGGPIVLSAWRASPGQGIAFLGGFFGTLVLGLSLFIILSATARKFDPRILRTLGAVAFCALLAFALYQIVIGLLALT
ncbi:MAG: hypothetical protein JW821_13035, partial [Deltaproteobacteria bacterium]|nr:hypothetical protein [Deltaproteobacteria bacterium]